MVAGPLVELLLEELRVNDNDWLTPAERRTQVRATDILLNSSSFGLWGSSVRPPLRYPSGELGEMIRYAHGLTDKVIPTTAELWWSIAGHVKIDHVLTLGAEPDVSKAMAFASRVAYSGRAVKPFAQEWPAEEVDADGLCESIHIIRYAELEAERVLKQEWEAVVAVASSLYRRKSHRMTGRQVEALLRRREVTRSAHRR